MYLGKMSHYLSNTPIIAHPHFLTRFYFVYLFFHLIWWRPNHDLAAYVNNDIL